MSGGESIPPDIALRLASLLPFQILQDACRGTDGEIIILIPSERRKCGSHRKAVQITRNVECRLRNLFRVEIITRIEADRPFIGQLHVSVDIQ